jgi:Protein of unknown function (DUF551)
MTVKIYSREEIGAVLGKASIYGNGIIYEMTAIIRQLLDAQQWIPVSERLPEEDVWVDVYVGNAYYMNHRRIAKLQRGEWRIGFDYEEAAGDIPGRYVTHWKYQCPPPQRQETTDA